MGFKKMVRVRDDALTEYLLAGRSCGKTYGMQKWLKGEKNDGSCGDLAVPCKYVCAVPNWHFYDVNRVCKVTTCNASNASNALATNQKEKAMSEKALLTMMRLMEAKLRELMSAEDYSKFSVEVAKKGFLAEMEDMADGEFKDFVMENFGRIVGEDGRN